MELGLSGRTALLLGPDDEVASACARVLQAEGARIVVDGPADIVVAHGPSRPGSALLECSSAAELHAAWDTVVETMEVFQRESLGMAERGWGRLVWVGTATSRSLDAGDDELDAVTSLAVRAANKVVGGELGSKGVTANAVLHGGDVTMEEVATTVAFVCSVGAGYLTGVTITVDAGVGSVVL